MKLASSSIKPKTIRTPETTAAVAECVFEQPSTSIHRRSSLRRILHKDLGMTPSKVRFPQWAYDRLTEDADFGRKKIIFSDEAYFILADMNTNKIVAFEAQKTRTQTLRSRRNQNESLFGAGFGPEA